MPRQRISTGTRWEQRNGYSRAVRVGDRVFVSGTLAVNSDGELIHPHSAHGQALYILDKIERTLHQLGATRNDVVLSRIYVITMNDADEAGLAHKEFFGDLMPCATLLGVSALADPSAKVEIEVEAIIGSGEIASDAQHDTISHDQP